MCFLQNVEKYFLIDKKYDPSTNSSRLNKSLPKIDHLIIGLSQCKILRNNTKSEKKNKKIKKLTLKNK